MDSFTEAYDNTISPEDRISTERITRLLSDKSRSPRSVTRLRRAVRADRSPASVFHVLLAAYRRGECVGFLKAMVCGRGAIVFVAYIGSEARTGARKALVSRLEKIVKAAVPEARYMVFEVTGNFRATPAAARLRLFRDYARESGYSIFTWPEYLQPDMEFERENDTVEEDACLGVIRLDRSAKDLDPEELGAIVRSIVSGIYAETFDDDERKQDAYKAYLSTVEELILERISSSLPAQNLED